MRIDIHNYEEFILDFLEGNLNEQGTEEMKAFLLIHPDIAEDLEDLDEIVLEAGNQILLDTDFTNQLKNTEIKAVASINEDNYKEVLIAEFEQDLTEEQGQDLNEFLLINPQLKQEQVLTQSLKVQSDSTVVFKNKSSLKKKNRAVVTLWTISTSVAAVLLISLWLFNLPSSNTRLLNLEAIQSIEITTLVIEESPSTLQLQAKNGELKISSFPKEIEELPIRPRMESLESLTSLTSQIVIEDRGWKNEMILLQAYAFDKNQRGTQIDLADFPATNKSGPIKLISSMLWKTTKASVKSFGDELISDDVKLFSAENIGDLTGGMFQIKRPSKGVE
ncbi:hypothetical protein [Lentimicrobium sp. S6]|uniref:hypothetical protein n=1 Tax=Lentimicrobium sp. S6 TaxID=2735872 RepID=UPI0015531F72|nr:hypothetical protein [Lentimicrobium sp. S6]NPD47140.1 hypothetical protein [Lentimicrobium sp. S6]